MEEKENLERGEGARSQKETKEQVEKKKIKAIQLTKRQVQKNNLIQVIVTLCLGSSFERGYP